MSVGRHTTYNFFGSLIPLLLALTTVPIYLKLVGADRYGVLAIAWLLLGYFGLFDLGLTRATSFRIAALRDASPQARADTFLAALSVNLLMGIVGGLALWVAGAFFFGRVFKVDENLRPEILAAVPLLACAVPIATLTGVLTGALQGRQKFLTTNVVSVTSTVLFQLAPLFIAWRLGPNLSWLLTAAISARILALLALAYRCHVELTRSQEIRLVAGEIPQLMKYGGWVTLTSIFGPMLVVVDRFAIGAVLGAAAVAAYTVPFQLAQRIAILPSALTNALFPRLSAAPAQEQRMLGEKALLVLSSFISLPVLGGIFIMEPFLHIWVGSEIGAQATPVGRTLLIGFWANAFALVPFTRLQASGRPDLVTKILLLEIPPYFLALYFGMVHLGLWGSALAICVRFIVDYLLLSVGAKSTFKELPVLSVNLALLITAAFLSSIWTITDWQWWLAATMIGAAMVVIGWRTLPDQYKGQIAAFARRV